MKGSRNTDAREPLSRVSQRTLIELYKQDKLSDVAEQAAHLLQSHHTSFFLWNMLGTVLAQMHRFPQAESAFGSAIQLRPKSAEAHNNLANSLRHQGKIEAAISNYEIAISLNPSFTTALNNLGVAYEAKGQHGEAADFYASALKTCWDHLPALRNLAQLPQVCLSNLHLSLLEKGITAIETSDVSQENRLFLKAHALYQLGDVENAFKVYCLANQQTSQSMESVIKLQELERQAKLKRLQKWTPKVNGSKAQIKTLIILGPSRSGKSTLERLLGESDNVTCTREAWRGVSKIRQVSKMRRNAGTEHLGVPDFFYLNETELLSKKQTVVTCTNPFIIENIAAVYDYLPGAHFCFVRRDRADLEADIFTRFYSRGNSYSYDPTALRNYLDWYEKTWAIASKLKNAMSVDFQTLHTSPQQELDRIQDMLGVNLRLPKYPSTSPPQKRPFQDLFAQTFPAPL